MLNEAVTQNLGAYIDNQKAAVAECVALRPILGICNREISYKAGVRRRDPLWRQTAARCNVRIYFSGGKGAALRVRQSW